MSSHMGGDVPSLSIESTCHIRDLVGTNNNEGQKTTVALFFLHASWNRTNAEHHCWDRALLQSLLLEAMGTATTTKDTRDAVVQLAGTIQVDQSDETVACCVGDDDYFASTRQTASDLHLPCPPASLPVLAVSVQSPLQKHARVRYLSDIPSSQLLSVMKQHDIESPCHQTTTPREWAGTWTRMIASTIDDLMVQETQHNNSEANAKRPSIQKRTTAAAQQQNTTSNTQKGSARHNNDSSSSSSDGNKNDPGSALRIFVAGDRSSVGKSSVCLGLLGSLVQQFGYAPSSLAYIKPATQCEAPQLVQAYCESVGIACVPVGPLVYYKGFTRAFLSGETGQTSKDLLATCGQAVDSIARGKKIVLVDGVGFPAVGSICGTDNGAVANACGYPSSSSNNNNNNSRRHPPGVIVVGGSGVGAAVDAFNLNATYFEMAQVPVMGGIFNKLSKEGYYSLENCKQQLTSYFQQDKHQQKHGRIPFGFVPLFDGLGDDDAIKRLDDFLNMFASHVDIEAILESAKRIKQQYAVDDTAMEIDAPVQKSAPPKKRFKANAAQNASSNNIRAGLSRIEIEGLASGQGARTA